MARPTGVERADAIDIRIPIEGAEQTATAFNADRASIDRGGGKSDTVAATVDDRAAGVDDRARIRVGRPASGKREHGDRRRSRRVPAGELHGDPSFVGGATRADVEGSEALTQSREYVWRPANGAGPVASVHLALAAGSFAPEDTEMARRIRRWATNQSASRT